MPDVECTMCLLDVAVSCVFMVTSCILPCSFQDSNHLSIHWIQMTDNALVHLYYNNQDQLKDQDLRFKGRTSLLYDQLSIGNASLNLTKVQIGDQGRYCCITSWTCIQLKVDAPVRKVNIQHVENRIICSSDGIYPQPELTWSTIPPSNVILQNKTEVQLTEQQLYNISSSLMLSDSITDLVYICTVNTRINSKRATLNTTTIKVSSNSDATILCAASNISRTGFSLTWRFNNSQTILNSTGVNRCTVSKKWSQHVTDVSESGSLTLKNLSSKHKGMYTCELSNAEETYITNTLLRIIEDISTHVAEIVPWVVGAILFVFVCLVVYWKCEKVRKDGQTNQTETTVPHNPGPSNGDVSNSPEEIPLKYAENGGGQK